MSLLTALHERFRRDRPFDGLGIAACLHITAETAMLVRLLQAGGATVSLAASNPLSTQDDIAAALAIYHGIAVFARSGVDRKGYYRHIETVFGTVQTVLPRGAAATTARFEPGAPAGQVTDDTRLRNLLCSAIIRAGGAR